MKGDKNQEASSIQEAYQAKGDQKAFLQFLFREKLKTGGSNTLVASTSPQPQLFLSTPPVSPDITQLAILAPQTATTATNSRNMPIANRKKRARTERENHTEEESRSTKVVLELVPLHIREFYQEIIIMIDIMKVNRIPFVTTLSQSIHFVVATPIAKMELDYINRVISDLIKLYWKWRFKIGLKTRLAGQHITLNTVGRDEHVPEIEWMHRLIKERCQSAYHNTPFGKLPQ